MTTFKKFTVAIKKEFDAMNSQHVIPDEPAKPLEVKKWYIVAMWSFLALQILALFYYVLL